jgi:hypothetical protein
MNPALELSLMELMPTKLKQALTDRFIERSRITLGTVIGSGTCSHMFQHRNNFVTQMRLCAPRMAQMICVWHK